MSHDDFAFEPIRGLPEKLPAGETLLWQGAPNWWILAIDAFHIRKVAAYFGLLTIWSLANSVADDRTMMDAGAAALWPIGFGCAAIAILASLAWMMARMTVYSITSKRVVLRHGVAVPMTINLPFSCIESAACKMLSGGFANLPLKLAGVDNRIAYLGLWPHARPWRFNPPEPMLRALPEGETVARLLAEALAGGPVTIAKRSPANVAALAPSLSALLPGGAS